MLNLYLYQHSQQFFNEHWKSQVEVDSSHKILVVTPSPSAADLFRAKITNLDSYEVVTISSFLSDLLQRFMPEQSYTSKAEMLISLAAVWRKFFPDESYDTFLRSYNLLSDLRSFTLDHSIIETVLEEYDPVFAKAIPIFNQMIEMQGWLDEHQAYFELSQRLRSQENLSSQIRPCIVFWGFKFMAGSQIDFLKALSIWSQVVIAFPEKAFEQCLESDWIKWLLDQKSRIVRAAKNETTVSKDKRLLVLNYPKKHLSFALSRFLAQQRQAKLAFILGNKRISSHEALEIPLQQMKIKIPVDILQQKIHQLSFHIEELIVENKSEMTILMDELKEYAQKSLSLKDFPMIKAVSLAQTFLNSWTNLSSDHFSINEFEKELMLEIMRLNAPRNNFIAQNPKQDLSVCSIFELEAVELETFKVVVANGDYQGIESRGQNFSENVEKYLISIGPIRRGELEFDLLKQSFDENINASNAVVFLESQLLEHSLEWRNLLEGFDIEMQSALIQKTPKQYGDWNFPAIPFKRDRISASRLQDFYDCQVKFYYKYVKKISPNIKTSLELQNSELGTIEHKVIEEYLKLHTELDFDRLIDLAKMETNKILALENKMISSTELAKYLQEIIQYAHSGLKMVFALQALLKTQEHFPEYAFEINTDGKIKNGSIDLMLRGPSTMALLDFKRTGFSIPSKSELQQFQKLQLWFYLNVLKSKNIWSETNKNTIGYLNLSQPSQSLIITNDEELIAQIKGHEAFEQIRSVFLFDEQWMQHFSDYVDLEKKLLTQYDSIQNYQVNPRSTSVCDYCSVSLICPKKPLEVQHV
jgi:RecB family exonuclease